MGDLQSKLGASFLFLIKTWGRSLNVTDTCKVHPFAKPEKKEMTEIFFTFTPVNESLG